ncbi:MAG: hypothetical protein WBX49_00400 [Candidatus Deferrimicrobiaceae bacterium]
MSLLERAGKIEADARRASRANDFVDLARRIALARGDYLQALTTADSERAPMDVRAVLKAAAAAGAVAVGSWGEPISLYDGLVRAFADSLRNFGAFDRLLPSMRSVPLRSRCAIVSAGAFGSVVAEGAPTPISELSFVDAQVAENKAICVLVLTLELARLSGPQANSLFGRELRRALTATVDTKFLELITDSISPISSSGGFSTNVIADVDSALQAVNTDAASELFILAHPAVAKGWSTRVTADGTIAFPQMSPKSGQIVGIETVVSDGVPAGTFVLVDANQLAAASTTIELDASTQSSLQFSTTPDSPIDATSVMQSLWQENKIALRALRFFGAKRLRDTAVAVVDGAIYSDDSPPA